MKLALAILGLALLVAGCGQAKDPFVGTWHRVDVPKSAPPTANMVERLVTTSPSELVIARVSRGHEVAWVDSYLRIFGPFRLFIRHGDELVDSFRSDGQMYDSVVRYSPSTARLAFWTTPDKAIPIFKMVKLSDSTALPSPSP